MSLSVSCLLALNTPGGPLGPSLEQEPGPPRRGCTGGRLHFRPQGCRLLFRGHPPASPSTWHGWAWACPLRVRCSVGGGEAGCCRLLSSRQRKSGCMTECQPAPPVSGYSSLQTRNAVGQSVSAFVSFCRKAASSLRALGLTWPQGRAASLGSDAGDRACLGDDASSRLRWAAACMVLTC